MLCTKTCHAELLPAALCCCGGWPIFIGMCKIAVVVMVAWFCFGGGYIYTGLMSWEQMLCFFGGSFVAHVGLAVVVSATTVFLQSLCCVARCCIESDNAINKEKRTKFKR